MLVDFRVFEMGELDVLRRLAVVTNQDCEWPFLARAFNGSRHNPHPVMLSNAPVALADEYV